MKRDCLCGAFSLVSCQRLLPCLATVEQMPVANAEGEKAVCVATLSEGQIETC